MEPWSMYIKCLWVLLTNVYWFRATGEYIYGCRRLSNLVIFGYIELLVINLMFLSKYNYFNYSYQYSLFIVNPVGKYTVERKIDSIIFCKMDILLFPSKATSSQPASNQFMDEVDLIEEWRDRFYEYQWVCWHLICLGLGRVHLACVHT